MIALGQKVRDAVTGFTGIATARVEYINGCIQFCVIGQAIDGKMPQGEYLDYQRLVVVPGEGIVLPSRDAGGPSRDTPSANYRG